MRMVTALSTVSQPLPEMEHLLHTKQLICFFSSFFRIFYVAEVRYWTWFERWCLKNSSKSQNYLSRLEVAVVCIGSWGCRGCLPKEYPFFARDMKPMRK